MTVDSSLWPPYLLRVIRAFLDVLYGYWYDCFPWRPPRDDDLYDGSWTPPRPDAATGVWSDTGQRDGDHEHVSW